MGRRRRSRTDPQGEALRHAGIRHPHPERVQASLFAEHPDFFHPQDLVQVKYEMLRAHHVDGLPAAQAARQFGLSRQTFYQAQLAFAEQGMVGLLPQRPGPKGPYKLTPPMQAFVEAEYRRQPQRPLAELADELAARFGVRVHPRTLRRLLQKKKRLEPPAGPGTGR